MKPDPDGNSGAWPSCHPPESDTIPINLYELHEVAVFLHGVASIDLVDEPKSSLLEIKAKTELKYEVLVQALAKCDHEGFRNSYGKLATPNKLARIQARQKLDRQIQDQEEKLAQAKDARKQYVNKENELESAGSDANTIVAEGLLRRATWIVERLRDNGDEEELPDSKSDNAGGNAWGRPDNNSDWAAAWAGQRDDNESQGGAWAVDHNDNDSRDGVWEDDKKSQGGTWDDVAAWDESNDTWEGDEPDRTGGWGSEEGDHASEVDEWAPQFTPSTETSSWDAAGGKIDGKASLMGHILEGNANTTAHLIDTTLQGYPCDELGCGDAECQQYQDVDEEDGVGPNKIICPDCEEWGCPYCKGLGYFETQEDYEAANGFGGRIECGHSLLDADGRCCKCGHQVCTCAALLRGDSVIDDKYCVYCDEYCREGGGCDCSRCPHSNDISPAVAKPKVEW